MDVKNFLNYLSTLAFIGFLLLIVYFSILYPVISLDTKPPFIVFTLFNSKQIIATNHDIDERYTKEILPQGKEIISKELEKIRQEQDDYKKLDEIFRWETSDWHNPQWEVSNFDLYNNSQNYISYNHDPHKLRAILAYEYSFFRQQNPDGVYLADDPYWLAYNKVGCCREIANLFSFMAQQSGIESRTVSSVFGQHRWAEVKINGEWMYYDPWCAYDRYRWNSSFKEKWFNKIENYRDNCHGFTVLNFYDSAIPNPEPTISYPFWYGVHDLKFLFGQK